MPAPVATSIRIKGARCHNLKNLDLEIPLNKLVAVCGVSGAGKSSLVFDTLYAEGQRRYVETFSPYARQFMERMDRPQVDSIEGIPPAVAIDRKEPVRTSRSTVATMSDLADFCKLLFARRAVLHCRRCQRPVRADTPETIRRQLLDLRPERHLLITFPFAADGDPAPVRDLLRQGYDRHVVEGRIESIRHQEPPGGTIDVLADRIPGKTINDKERIIDSLEAALRMGAGRLDVWTAGGRRISFSDRLHCAFCDMDYPRAPAGLFSFNSPMGACPACRGFGRVMDVDLDLVIPDRSLSLNQGAVRPWGGRRENRRRFRHLTAFCRRAGIDMDLPFERLDTSIRETIIDGGAGFEGIRGFFRRLESKTYKMQVRVFLSRYRGYYPCPQCRATRFRPEALAWRLAGRNIAQVYALTVAQALSFFQDLETESGDPATTLVLEEIKRRLNYLSRVGVGYLTLDRQSRTLSGGEVQRVALASALGADLVNTLYVLDEPSAGLHPKDCRQLASVLRRLRDLPNTIVVVEHDPEILKASDYLLELGPGAGRNGGRVVYFGPTGQAAGSPTGAMLARTRRLEIPAQRRTPQPGRWIEIRKAAAHNLKDMDVAFPLGLLTALTGVSGSGKSTLAADILYRAISRSKGQAGPRPGSFGQITGAELVDEVVLVDQQPAGRTPRANVLTYVKALDPVRRLLAATGRARRLGLGPGYFSFNIAGGRCETCKGEGFEKIEMQFLADVFVTCPDCRAKRFTPQVLSVTYKGLNIDSIFGLTVDQALEFFAGQPSIVKALTPLARVGLGYITLGQPLNTLSGGEAQRLRLARHLGSGRRGHVLYILDEPTTGLHFRDIRRLLEALQDLVDRGNSVLFIEHQMDLVAAADWVIDLGPEGGPRGGRVVCCGVPEKIALCAESRTGEFLRPILGYGKQPAATARAAESRSAFSAGSAPAAIRIRGARQHNLKNVSLDIDHGQLVVLTGVSGSGKSTLAFDIVFAEGQRRYLDSLAPYVRRYLKILEKPDVDSMAGLSPTVAIEQRVSHAGRRSTVATLTEVYHFLRLLMSRLGTAHCPGCGRAMVHWSRRRMLEAVAQAAPAGSLILAPVITGRKGFHKQVLERALSRGLTEARIDGNLEAIKPGMALDRYRPHTIELVMGKVARGRTRAASARSLAAKALEATGGHLVVMDPGTGRQQIFSSSSICPDCGLSVPRPDPLHFSFNSPAGGCPACDGTGTDPAGSPDTRSVCPACGGSRLNPPALAVKLAGRSVWDLVRLTPAELEQALAGIEFSPDQQAVAQPILSEIRGRLELMQRLGLGYLALDRSGDTLSGGEAQRVRLAAQLGSNLTGVTYVLDEPTIGLHPRDNGRLLEALKALKDKGNTLIVVEHDEETIRAADTIIDLGPGAGRNGGQVVARGVLEDLKRSPGSVTGALLGHRQPARAVRTRSLAGKPRLLIRSAAANNLKNIDVAIPLEALVCVTGVSGSGKSSLVKETLARGLQRLLAGGKRPLACKVMEGWKRVKRVLEVNHSPIGRTPRSVPASYVGFLDAIRRLFAATPEARRRGYGPGRFSFNLAGGQCPECKGHGTPRVEMAFLPAVYVSCPACGGRRFNPDTLRVRYKGKTISEVLAMTFAEAQLFFSPVPSIARAVELVCRVGLGYLQLGQPSPTLSGGEAQRIKLARQLARPGRGHTMYILDEPTTGLHAADIQLLLGVLQGLVEQGNTVVVIEHNLEIIRAADHIIDLGPGGGPQGGQVVTCGSPRQVARRTRISHTARYLGQISKK